MLVSGLGIILLVGVGFTPPGRDHDTEHCQGAPARTPAYNQFQGGQSEPPYHDEEDESFFDCIRRRSQSIAQEFRQELVSITRGFSGSGNSSTEHQPMGTGTTQKMRRFSLDSAFAFSWKNPDPDMVRRESCDSQVSPISVTGREDEPKDLRKRSSQVRNEVNYDLEAQESIASLL